MAAPFNCIKKSLRTIEKLSVYALSQKMEKINFSNYGVVLQPQMHGLNQFTQIENKFSRNYCASKQSITVNGSVCWKCSQKLDRDKINFTCPCGVVQPINENKNYYELFGLRKSYDIELSNLTKLFRQLQMQLHPDKFSQKSSVSVVLLNIINKCR